MRTDLSNGTKLIVIPGKTLGVSTACRRRIYLEGVLMAATALIGWALTNAGGTRDAASKYLIVDCIFKHCSCLIFYAVLIILIKSARKKGKG